MQLGNISDQAFEMMPVHKAYAVSNHILPAHRMIKAALRVGSSSNWLLFAWGEARADLYRKSEVDSRVASHRFWLIGMWCWSSQTTVSHRLELVQLGKERKIQEFAVDPSLRQDAGTATSVVIWSHHPSPAGLYWRPSKRHSEFSTLWTSLEKHYSWDNHRGRQMWQ